MMGPDTDERRSDRIVVCGDRCNHGERANGFPPR
jgi:hypothetical protein